MGLLLEERTKQLASSNKETVPAVQEQSILTEKRQEKMQEKSPMLKTNPIKKQKHYV